VSGEHTTGQRWQLATLATGKRSSKNLNRAAALSLLFEISLLTHY
jgi:hypothetical protein